jgi:hypothetical protein
VPSTLLVLKRAQTTWLPVLLIKFWTKSSTYSAGKQTCRGVINFHQDQRSEKPHALSLSLSQASSQSLFDAGSAQLCTLPLPLSRHLLVLKKIAKYFLYHSRLVLVACSLSSRFDCPHAGRKTRRCINLRPACIRPAPLILSFRPR